MNRALVYVYLTLLGLGFAVTFAVYLDAQHEPPAERRQRVAFSLLCTALGLFPVPLFRYRR